MKYKPSLIIQILKNKYKNYYVKKLVNLFRVRAKSVFQTITQRLPHPVSLGIDLSDKNIKLVTIRKIHNHYYLEETVELELPANLIQEKEIKNINTVAEYLKKAINQLKNRSIKYTAIALADTAVITKIIYVEKNLSAMDREGQIIFEVNKQIKYTGEDIHIDYHFLSDFSENFQDKAFVAVAKSKNIQTYIEVLKQAKLIPKLIDIESFALQKAYTHFINDLSANKNMINEKIMVIDVNFTRILSIIYEKKLPIFTQAELWNTKEIIQTDILEAIKRILHFYLTSTEADNTDLKKLILTGEDNLINDLPDILKKDLTDFSIIKSIQIEIIKIHFFRNHNKNSLNFYENNHNKLSSSLAIATGLALRGFEQCKV